MSLVFKFSVSINGGEKQDLIIKEGLYNIAALKSLDVCVFKPKDNDEPNIVRVWQESLVDKFGSHTYSIKDGKAIYKEKLF